MADTATTLGLGKVLPVTGSFAIPLVVTSSLLSLNVVKARIDLNTWEGDKTINGKDGAGVKQPDGNTYDPLLLATHRKKLTAILAVFSVLGVLHAIGLGKANQACRAAGYFGTQFVQLGLVGWLGLLTKDYWGF